MDDKNDLKDKAKVSRLVKKRVEKEKQEIAGAEDQNHTKEDSPSSYFMNHGYLCRTKHTKDGAVDIRLCNFSAEITEENSLDDGKEINHFFTIEGKLWGTEPLPKIEIPANNFTGLSWLSKWGSKPCLEPGQTVKDTVRHAIQTGSHNTKAQHHYAHTGWRAIEGQMVYLHAGGAIGKDDGVSVKLSRELERYAFPPLPLNKSNSATGPLGLKESLSFLDIGITSVTIPLFSLIYLAPLTTLLNPMPNFSLYLFGISGTFKTTAAILALSHFGHFSGVESLSNFDDTVGILEKRAFTLKDTLHIVDDYHPSSNKRNAEARESTAQRMIRSYSNRTARGRLNSDMTERGRYEPRGMMLMTAEELPILESTLARVCIIEVEKSAINLKAISALQKAAPALPSAMAQYIDWVRENLSAISSSFPERFRELRQKATSEAFHRKLPEQAAFLSFAMETATAFFQEKRFSRPLPAGCFWKRGGSISDIWQPSNSNGLRMMILFPDSLILLGRLFISTMPGLSRCQTMPANRWGPVIESDITIRIRSISYRLRPGMQCRVFADQKTIISLLDATPFSRCFRVGEL